MVPAAATLSQAMSQTTVGLDPMLSLESKCLNAALDQQFLSLLSSYRGNGGLARADEVVEIFRNRRGPPMADLARWIVQRRIISFEWQSCIWLPLFQFNPIDLSPHAGLDQVLAELKSVHASVELAQWFVSPNEWLSGRMPAQALLDDIPSLLDAARAERFIVRG